MCDVRFLAVDFKDKDILKIIWTLDINRAHRYDNNPTRMINIFDSTILKTLSIIFRNSFYSGIFPDNWKRSNIATSHKKGNKQLIQNYVLCHNCHCVISSKIFENLIFNSLSKFVRENNLLCSNQSEFRKTDSCVNKLLSIVESFDKFPYLETHSDYLVMSKAFDWVWYEGLVYKLKKIGVSEKLLTLFESFLNNRYQEVLPNGQNL